MSFTSQLCLAILLCIPICLFDLHPDAQDSGFHPERQAPIIQRSRDFTIRLKKDGEKLGVWIDKGSHPIGSFWLPDEMAQVDRIEVVANNHAVLLGYANGDVNEIVIVDLNSGKMIDKIWCFAPALSPKKRFLAFVKFYTPHFLQGVSDEYMVYDFEKSPKMNRSAGIPSDDFRNVGRAVYPVGATNKPDDNIAKPELEIHKLASGQFFWAPDEEQLAFADRYQDKVFVIKASFLDVSSNP